MENTNKNDGEMDLSNAGAWLDFEAEGSGLDTDHELSAAPAYEALPAQETHQLIETASAAPLISEPAEEVSNSTEAATEQVDDSLTSQQVAMIRSLLERIEDHTKQIKNILEPYGSLPEIKTKLQTVAADKETNEGEVVEGFFDGQSMIGPDGREYAVPANYASKSRLVEGDLLKLIISRSGAFIFKQIQPVDRRRVTGILEETENGDFFVMSEDRRWRVLSASVTYYKGEAGDQTVIVIPKNGLSKWGAVENVIKR